MRLMAKLIAMRNENLILNIINMLAITSLMIYNAYYEKQNKLHK